MLRKRKHKLLNVLKPVKLRRHGENNKYGVAARSLEELLKKGCATLQVPLPGSRVCLYEDGTEVNYDLFESLPDHTELVLLADGQRWSGAVFCDIGLLLSSSEKHTDLLIKCAKNLLTDDQSLKRQKILRDLLHNLDDKSEAETREEDKDWFEGIESRFKTKSQYMKFNCASRIRGYQNEVVGYAPKIKSSKVRAEYYKIVNEMLGKLKSAEYNGCYFDRKDGPNCLCSKEGWFSCQGAFDQDKCMSLHSINPYVNRESRILFSTWNLDHGIEKKRTILPTLAEALEGHKNKDINCDYFYRLLFTRENLRLVHIVCHKKSAHNMECDRSRMYERGTKRKTL